MLTGYLKKNTKIIRCIVRWIIQNLFIKINRQKVMFRHKQKKC